MNLRRKPLCRRTARCAPICRGGPSAAEREPRVSGLRQAGYPQIRPTRPAALPPKSLAIVSPPRPPRRRTRSGFVSSPRTAGFFTGWDRIASEVVVLDPRSEAAPDQHDRGLSDLVRQLPAHSEALRTRRPAWLRAGQSGRVRAGGSGTAPAAWSGVRTCGWPQRCGMSGCGDPGQALARTPLSRSCLPRRAGGRRAVARSHPRQPRRLRRSTSKSILETQPRSGLIDGSGGAKADAGMRRTWTRTASVAATGRRTGT